MAAPTRRQGASLEQKQAWAKQLLKEGYESFAASEGSKDSGDGKETTEVKLYYGPTGSNTVPGKSGYGKGHAEMAALYEYYSKTHGNNERRFLANVGGTKLDCTSKPCCVRCSAILGLLGVQPYRDSTKKTQDTMGSTEWGMHPDLRNVLRNHEGIQRRIGLHEPVPEGVFEAFSSLSLQQ